MNKCQFKSVYRQIFVPMPEESCRWNCLFLFPPVEALMYFQSTVRVPLRLTLPGSHGPTPSVFTGKGSLCSSACAGSPSLQLHLFTFTFLEDRTEHRWDARYPEQWCKHCPCSLGKYELLNTLEIAFPLSWASCKVICSCLSTNTTFFWF